ncbi:midasin isoform X2 [Eurosta solidaginis]|uniref:midasin isoform X2 n=1 Tax=Eurosta solidaginis TaxID=178769 RepID=UPI003530A5C1
MEISVNKIRRSVVKLLQHLQSTSQTAEQRILREFINKNELDENDLTALFTYLSDHILDERWTAAIAFSFEHVLLLLVTRSIPHDEQLVDASNFETYQKKCVALSTMVRLSIDMQRYAVAYFRNKPAPFECPEGTLSKKRSKNGSTIASLDIVKCCHNLLRANPVFFKDLWNWSIFLEQYVETAKEKSLYQLYCNHIIAILTNMTAAQLQNMNDKFSPSTLLQWDEERNIRTSVQTNIPLKDATTDKIITLTIKSHLITNIEGVLLPIFNKNNYEFYAQNDGLYDNIVNVDSTKVNLRSIALGISSAKAICLSGPVGCGKTTLVEYLARKTGRIYPKPSEVNQTKTEIKAQSNGVTVNGNDKLTGGNKRKLSRDILNNFEDNAAENYANTNGFLRIQLGEQTDSKMLLGQYRCTDVPGEFVWLPGVLTKAVMNGYWLLLEDLDSATQDTYTILSSLLENNYLSVPGFRDCVKIEPGFQLFVTVRTNKSVTNSSQKSLYALLEKYLYTINILPLSRNELCKIVSTNYQKLATIANRIVDVFLTFSSGDHTAADNLRQQESSDKADTTEKYISLPFEPVTLTSIPNSTRLVSTRDLIKLCQRSNPGFSVTSTECAYFVFQNAVDVFCSYLSQGKDKTKLITSIGAKLGIIQSRCEYFADEYKPEVFADNQRIKVGRTELYVKPIGNELSSKTQIDLKEDSEIEGPTKARKRQKLMKETAEQEIVMLERSLSAAKNATFSFTRMASCILERIAVCVSHAEPVLLVGETGVGKTSAVQYLAERTFRKLVVVNMNNQSDVSDLIGGFKPVDLTYVMTPLRLEFDALFRETFNVDKNITFLNKLEICYNQGNHFVIIKLMQTVINSVFAKAERNELRQKELGLIPRWKALKVCAQKLNTQLSKSINISFAFIPGSLVNCIKNGNWILLDEINLASAEMLECLSTILEPDGSVVLLERGDFTPVKRHPDFRIFACMNPNTDIGKKDLPVGIRNRFTEFFVDELTTDADLTLLISDYLKNTGIQSRSVANLVQLYKKLKQLSKLELNDGLGNRPVYSLRTLCRSLRICAKNLCGSVERNLYESFCMSFLTQLDAVSHNVVLYLIQQALLSNVKAVLNQSIPKPGEDYLNFEGYWIQQGVKVPEEYVSYILTKSVKENLRDLARIISIGKLPVLLQGPTSAGKTSLIDYVARRSGNHCLRINNHEHTDLQEYIGTYVADVTGKLSFKEGVLVQAMRNGYWIILDELNLASTDILEALNRVLDDNRELYIPETQTLVKAHANFMLFATQNPPGLYGGRKTLSRAFKNRFIELHFPEIPRDELETILEKRCLIPTSYAKKMVLCMSDLQKNRKTTTKNVFTLRDLFRWGNRYTYADKQLLDNAQYDWNQHLVEEGYLVLSSKVRTDIEIEIIEETLYKNFRKHVDCTRLFDAHSSDEACSPVTRAIINDIKTYKMRADIVWTRNMTRMAVLTAKALQFNEPVLLVGPTGCGKTTVCQLLASIRDVQLRILNCHMHTEGADFLGGLRPCRDNSSLDEENNTGKKLFEWADGPLILAMKEGSYFMADEISLAEDSVLERLNCILEPERTVLLAEKGGVAAEGDLAANATDFVNDFVVQAKEGFQFLATMNPGGDFGKKELSPALRNRFTEIWCLPSDCKEDLIQIASNCMLEQAKTTKENTNKAEITQIATYLVEVVLHMSASIEKFKYSIRDILAWANYIVSNAHLTFPEKAIFGLETIFLDALELMPHETLAHVELLRKRVIEFAIARASTILYQKFTFDELAQKRGTEVIHSGEKFGIQPFFIATNASASTATSKSFLFEAPTTKQNLFRLLSALSLRKPILLEGPPGVGKTSTVESIAAIAGYRIVRINLCEHTDLADLFGTDLPAEDNILDAVTVAESNKSHKSDIAGSFVWRDGPLLAALKAENTWILLDELNLAPQSVLEGLNAILDHRGEVYIPELNKTFTLSKETRVFACQNPLKQGGGRKGLPQSFLNRFNKVYLRKLTTQDLLYVVNGKYQTHFTELQNRFAKLLTRCQIAERVNLFELYKKVTKQIDSKIESINETALNAPTVILDLTQRLVQFSEILDSGISTLEFGYRGGPYEINLRDILRWCDLLVHTDTGFIFHTDSSSRNHLDLFCKNFESFLLTLYERMKLVYYQRMRCEEDKRFIRNAFTRVFHCDADALNAISEDVALYWTSDKIYLNDIVLERNENIYALRPLRNREQSPILLSSQREILKNLVECVRMEKPVLLCGPTDTGKTKLVDLLCTLSNQVCNTDNIDDSVTGSFQQIKFYKLIRLMDHVLDVVPLYGSYTPLFVLRKFFTQKSDNAKRAREIINKCFEQRISCKVKQIEVQQTHSTEIPDDLQSALHEFINEQLEEKSNAAYEDLDLLQTEIVALQNAVNSQDELEAELQPKEFDLRLLALREFYLAKALCIIGNCSASNDTKINEIYCEETTSLNNFTWCLIKTYNSNMYKRYEKVWTHMMEYLKSVESVQVFEQLLQYLNGSYRHFNSYYAQLINAVNNIQLCNLATRENATNVRRVAEDIDCTYTYDGCSFLNVFLSLVYQENGTLRPIPLNELSEWQATLKHLQQLLWQNAALMATDYSIVQNNFSIVKMNAQKLLHEVAYVRHICESLEREEFNEYNEHFEKLVQILEKEHTEILKLESMNLLQQQYTHVPVYNQQIMQYQVALLNSLIGAIEVCLLTFTPIIDPVEKNRLKNLYVVEDINCLYTMTTAYDFMRIVMKYKNFGVEIYKAFEARLIALHVKQQKFAQKLALRPEKCLYSKLVEDIGHYLRTNCSPQSLITLIESAQRSWLLLTREFHTNTAQKSLNNNAEVIGKLNLWITNSQRFLNHTLKAYMDHYQDFIQPLQYSIDKLRFSFEGLKILLTQASSNIVQLQSEHKQVYTNLNSSEKLSQTLANIAEFPATHHLIKSEVEYSTHAVLKQSSYINCVMQQLPHSEYSYFGLLKAKLTELRNNIAISQTINECIFHELDFIFSVTNEIWQAEEERRRAQKAEEESLYVNKTKCAEEDEELLELQEIETHFPTNVEEDFGEFLIEATLEKVVKLDKKANLKKKITQLISDEDYTFLSTNFIDLMEQYTRVYYYKATKTKRDELKFVEPFEARMRAFVPLYAYYKRGLNDAFTEETYNSCIFALALQQQQLSNTDLLMPQTLNEHKSSYNYYKDSNIPEIMGCIELLKDIEAHTEVQLDLYPEHAGLIDIKRVIERIRTLPATAPVVRFNTGFQLLRQKLAQWNEIAHKGNHMRQQEVGVAECVQRWMKLELQCWRNCLNQTKEKVEANAHKYWFFIYQLLREYRLERDLDSTFTDMKSAEKRFADGEVLDESDCLHKKSKVSANDIVRILRQFVEAANYGDFHVRLQLLQAFELYLHNLDQFTVNSAATEKARALISGLRNLQIYFAQFVQEIEETALNMRSPIEKKLKELVKIESYNKDLSYFSMRNNVARVHRNLNKFLKEYQQQLQQKITPVFQPKDATVKDYNFENDKGRELRYDARIKYYLVEVKNFIAAAKLSEKFAHDANNGAAHAEDLVVQASNDSQQLLQKVGRLFKISRNIVKETVRHAKFPKLTIALDSVLCAQLERCDELRALSVDRSKERPKQLIEAKQILQQKRKGLADLFKTLAQLGLSFKSGLMELSLRNDFSELTIPPFCIKTMLGARNDKRLHAHLLHLNENLDRYYAKCEFKLRLLQNIMLAPLSELGPPNIERIKGFAVDMFLLVQSQRRILSSTCKQIYDLEILMQQIKDIHDVACVEDSAKAVQALGFNETRKAYICLRESISHIRYVIEQFALLLTCAPSTESAADNVLLSSGNRLLQNSPYYSVIVSNCEYVLTTAKSTLIDMLKNDKEFLSVAMVSGYKATHAELQQNIQQIFTSLSRAVGEDLPFAKPISALLSDIKACRNRISSSPSTAPTNLEQVEAVLERILHAVLLALQKLYKKHTEIPTATQSTEESTSSPSKAHNELELQEKHLKEQLHTALESDWETLNIANIVQQLSHVLLTLKHAIPTQLKLASARKLITLMPILEQYYLLADYYLFQQLGAHKVSAKMLSVMLTVFVEIGSKGFCVPPDLMHDEEGQAKKQKEGEGFGLEDGTGENDASDRIESEDQLDDAKRPEDRKEEQGKQPEDCKQDKSIDVSEDFDAKMQDIEKNEEDDSGESEDDGEMNKEMGETGQEAEKLDEQIWGDDEEKGEEEDEEQEQDDNEQGKGTKDEKDTHNDLETKNEAAKENDDENEGLDATNDTTNDKRKQPEKDVENMKEPEVDEDQPNPYHNELEEPPEAEEMDLGDMNMDNEQEGEDEREGEENPFDIDTMKENMEENPNEPSKDEQEEEGKENETKSDDSDSEAENADTELRKDTNSDEEKERDEEDKDGESDETQTRGEQEAQTTTEDKQEAEKEEEEHSEKPEEYEQSKDKTSKEENMQSVPETENKGTPDQVQSEKDEEVKQEQKLDEQETGEEKDGVGQAENDTNEGGHQGIAETKEKVAKHESTKERESKEKRKQGKTNEERTLGEAEMNKLKQLKTIDKVKEQQQQSDDAKDEEDDDKKTDAEEFQHVKDPKKSDITTLDNATEEQSKKIQHQEDEQNDEEQQNAENDEMENNEDESHKTDEDAEDPQEMSAEKFDKRSDKPSKTDRSKERTNTKEEMEVEGEIVTTMTAERSDDTSAHCNKEILLENVTRSEELSTAEQLEMRRLYQQQLTANKTTLPVHKDYETWQTISNRMAQNAREFCEQLRLILEPTKCTRLKGDYRTGRRINMKKIIPYIASQFRKDKIWLRRTKAAQRDYKITIAIDDSKSMHHNNSKTLTLEAISLVSQALTLLESGRLSIISFGEAPKIILNHTEQFDGPKLVNALNFAQDKTKIAELLDFVRTANVEEGSMGSDNGLFENLLLVLSDGRNIFGEGRVKVRNAIKLARLQRIFIVYIIIDNPDNKDSILDIQTMEMLPDKRMNIKSYLDDFPFPYYVIVRDLNQLPLVLSEAMRQWFELVNSEM